MVKRLLRKLGILPRGKAYRLRREANLNRDAGRWNEAAEAYRLYLTMKPQDLAVWRQYADALEQGGLTGDAIDAYRSAIRLNPESSAARDHLVRMLVRAGEETAAIEVILDALAREVSVNTSALVDTTAWRAPRPARDLPAGMTLYSVHDMIAYLHHHATLSGIQRVQAGIARHLIAQGSDQVAFVVSGTLGRAGSEQFGLIGKAELAAVIDYATSDDVQMPVLQERLVRCTLSAQPVVVGHGHTMVVLGAFWALGSTPKSLWPAKRAGARIGVYVYDLIPLTHPQFCVPELTRDFCRGLSQMFEFADFFVTISEYTRLALCDLMAIEGVAPVPTATVPLAHTLTRDDTGISWPRALAGLKDTPFVAYVSTVEGRKNHIYVVRVWQRLVQQGIDVPHLVFVGRRGWRNDALYRLLEETDNLSGKVHIVHDLDDAELNGIYARARFTVFTSFVEGWGLPVGESLMHGTPCVASNTSSIPEVGGAFVDYVDPDDIDNGVEVIGRMITRPDYLQGRREQIREHFRPRPWSEVGQDFVHQVETLSAAPARMPTAPRIAAGDFVAISPKSRLHDPLWYFSDVSESLVRDDFYGVEHFGAWMKGRQGVVRFRSNAPPRAAVLVYLAICASDRSSPAVLTVTINDRQIVRMPVSELPILDDAVGDSLLRCEAQVAADGMVSISLELDGPVAEQSALDPRRFAIGLRGVGIAALEGRSRSDLLESILLTARRSKAMP